MEKPKFYLTTAIAYASRKPHIGNTYEIIMTDAVARYKRQRGYDVFFMTGTDEHGQKIEDLAKAAGISPQDYVDNVAGDILPKPDIDIKGGQLRGSKVPKVALKFAEDFSNELVMDINLHGQVDAHEVIAKIRAFEERIFNELQAGVTEWLPAMSVKTKDKYANPMGSPWYYYYVWQNVFAAKYGDIIPPLKTPAVPVLAPTESYWSWLRDQDKDIHDRFVKFLSSKDERGVLHKWPSSIVINPVGGKVPPELIPLIRVKDIIKSSVMPCHLLLRQIPINCGFDDDNNLFSDDYPIVKGKKHG